MCAFKLYYLTFLSLCFASIKGESCYNDSRTRSTDATSFTRLNISNENQTLFNLNIVADENATDATLDLDLSLPGYPYVLQILENSTWFVSTFSEEIPQDTREPTDAPTDTPTDAPTAEPTEFNENSSSTLDENTGGVGSTSLAGSSANVESTLMMLFSSSNNILPEVSALFLSCLLPYAMAESNSSECVSEINATLTIPSAYQVEGAGTFQITEESSSEIIIEYICATAEHYDILPDPETGLCSACTSNPCGLGSCVEGDHAGLYDCDCGSELDYYISPRTGLPGCSDNELIMGFDLDIARTINLPFSFSTAYDTEGYPSEVLDLVVDWGDNTTLEAYSGSDANTVVSHTYDEAFTGIIDIRVTGNTKQKQAYIYIYI